MSICLEVGASAVESILHFCVHHFYTSCEEVSQQISRFHLACIELSSNPMHLHVLLSQINPTLQNAHSSFEKQIAHECWTNGIGGLEVVCEIPVRV